MPSWKKVILSGSDAALNNLNVTNSITASVISASQFTGSLFGTASNVLIATSSLFVSFPILFDRLGVIAKDSVDADFTYNPNSGRFFVNEISSSAITSSLFGTSSWANNSISSSYVLSSSYSLSSSFATSASNVVSSSYSNTVNILNNSINRVLTAGGPGNAINAEQNFTFTGNDLFLTASYNQKGDMVVINSIGTAFKLEKEALGSIVAQLGDIDNGSSGTILVVDDTNRLIGIKFDNGAVSHVFDGTGLNLQGNLIAGVDEFSAHSITGSVGIDGGPVEIRGNLAVTNIIQTSKLTGSFISNDGNNRIVTSDGDGTFTAESGLTYTPGLLNVSGSTNITGSLTVTGTGSFNVLKVNYISASVIYTTGSNILGDQTTDTQILSGSVYVVGPNFTWNNSTVITSGVTSSMSVLSASYASSSTSASYALNATSASYALSSSYALNATSASYASTASSANSFIVRNSLTASGLNYPSADNGEFSFIQTDGNGNLSLQYVNTLYETVYNGEATQLDKGTPVYISGSQGANSIAYRADAGNPSKMPVVYVTADNIASADTGRAIALGLITGVNTTGYPGGTEIYVGVGGGWTSTRPTGSAIVQVLGYVTREGIGGQGVILNPGPANLPNLPSGSVWLGNSGSVPIAVSSASLFVTSASNALTASTAEAIKVTGNNANTTLRPLFTIGNSSFNNTVYTDGSDSITYNPGLDILTLTGSLNILSGSITVTSGSVTVNTGSFIGDLTGTASWAQSASNAVNAQTASYVLNAISSSFASTASYVNTLNQNVIISGGLSTINSLNNFTRNNVDYARPHIYLRRPSGSSQIVVGALSTAVDGTYTPSKGYRFYLTNMASGSGTTSNVTQHLAILENGDVEIDTKSSEQPQNLSGSAKLYVGGNIWATGPITASIVSASSFTGSLFGTASWAQSASNAINAQTASFLPVATYNITASWAQSASNAVNAQTASFLPVGTYNITASWAQSASNAVNSQTASFLPVGTYNITASWAQSASNAINARTASFLPVGTYNITSSWATNALTASFLPVGTYNITASWATNALTASYVNPLRQNVLITGSLNITGGLNVIGTSSLTGSTFITSGALSVNKSGSTVVDIQGSQGTLFTITDTLSGSLFSVNNISGLPILEVFSDDTVIAGGYNQNDFVITGSKVGIGTRTPSDKLTVSGSTNSITQRLTASLYSSESANLTTIGATSGSSLYESGFVKVTTDLGTITEPTYIDMELYKIDSSSVGYYRSTNLIEFTSASFTSRISFNFGGYSVLEGNYGGNNLYSSEGINDITFYTIVNNNGDDTFIEQLNVLYSNLEVELSGSILVVKVKANTSFSGYTYSIFSHYEIFKT